ncbi:hypothetical protein OUZ56_012110 [Daphnia magna]|uniref:Secreted protein n=1 Tax=Daphnia magna TaxID=35525 RepID=A0ABQ9Z286_9CRUS|nr:hypothetical protein OUZ56_012110 [Daphnia magna]
MIREWFFQDVHLFLCVVQFAVLDVAVVRFTEITCLNPLSRVIELMVAALNAKFSHKPTMTSYLPYPSGGCVMHFRNCGGKFKIFGRSMVLVVLTLGLRRRKRALKKELRSTLSSQLRLAEYWHKPVGYRQEPILSLLSTQSCTKVQPHTGSNLVAFPLPELLCSVVYRHSQRYSFPLPLPALAFIQPLARANNWLSKDRPEAPSSDEEEEESTIVCKAR